MIEFHELTSEEIEEWAIRLIGDVDYDIEKECRNNLEDFGEDSTVDDVMTSLELFMLFLKNKSNA